MGNGPEQGHTNVQVQEEVKGAKPESSLAAVSQRRRSRRASAVLLVSAGTAYNAASGRPRATCKRPGQADLAGVAFLPFGRARRGRPVQQKGRVMAPDVPSDARGETPTINPWQSVAKRVADIISVSGIENFREAVRAVARERLCVQDERERPEEERREKRREALKKNGVLYRKDALPKEPGVDWYLHCENVRGKIKLPPKIAPPPKQPEPPSPPSCLRNHIRRKDRSKADKDKVAAYQREKKRHKENMRAFWPKWHRAIIPFFKYVKQQGFPNDKNGEEYCLLVCCWLPNDLEPDDPDNFIPNESLLPVPRRALTDAEKKTILAAVYDAHWRGGEKIAPWGVAKNEARPESWPEHAELADRRAAVNYASLVRKARQLGKVCKGKRVGEAFLPVVLSWVDVLEPPDDEEGPVAPDAFVWQGVTYRGLPRKPFYAVRFLWTQPNKAAEDSELAEPVWEDKEALIPDHAIKGLREQINAFFRDNGVPWHATAKHRALALCSGPPRAAKPKRPRKHSSAVGKRRR